MLARIIVFIFTLGLGFLPLQLQAQTVLDTVCAGAPGETYKVMNTTGSGYTWNVSGGTLVEGQGSSEVTIDWGIDTGIFEITVLETNALGCPGDTVRAFVWIRNGVKVDVAGPNIICKGQPIILSASGADRYSWSTGATGNAITYIPTKQENLYVVGETGCGLDTAYFFLNVYDRPTAVGDISPAIPNASDVVNFVYKGDFVPTVIWNINGQRSIEGEDVEHTFNVAGKFNIELIAIDANGCTDTTVKTIDVKPSVEVFIPNAFTPNSDDLNQTFAPVIHDVKSLKLRIVNRWGQLVFEGQDKQAEWDGTYQGQLSPEGVYVYLIEAIGEDGRKYVYDGTLQLIR